MCIRDSRYTVSVLVQNQPGVLSRVSGLFSRRGFNIDSLAVGPTQDEDISRITLTVQGDAAHVDQLVQQLYKLISVQKVLVLDPRRSVERQLVLVKVAAGVKERDAVMRIVDIFRARVVDVTRTTMTVESTGEDDNCLLYTSRINWSSSNHRRRRERFKNFWGVPIK